METLPDSLSHRITLALSQTEQAPGLPADFHPVVSPATNPRFGDYQSNAALVLAETLRMDRRQLASAIVEKLDVSALCEPPEVAPNGFLNFRLHPDALAARVLETLGDDRHGVPTVPQPEIIVIDFSAPNVAKPMHVGHIRSTIIGDCLARVARFLGHHVITDNHIGDWGTQFGMILHGWKTILRPDALESDPIAELLRLYKEVNARAEADPAVMDQCREELVRLQGGDRENLEIWKRCVDLSLEGLQKIYDQLGVRFDHFLGESFYNDALGPLVGDLLETGLARESDGAICIFSEGSLPPETDPFKISRGGEWQENPAIVRKSDGGFLYATTDLATIDYRVREWQAQRIWYVVGAPQQLHFRQLFAAARRRGHEVDLTHIAFGSIFGSDRKPFKTRSGENVGLVEVLDEAVQRALAFLEQREAEDDKFVLDEADKPAVARAVGLGSVKYAELSQARMTDYVFDWNKMLSLKGSTAPYLLYSYVRSRGIFRKLDEPFTLPDHILLDDPAERALALRLIRFGETVPDVLQDFKPNILALYLFDLAKSYHAFFQACPVLKAEPALRASRLALCELTSRVLRQGLDLLGIDVVERM